MANNYEFNIIIKGLEATSNGASAEDISINAKGEYSNELVAVIGSLCEGLITKIPDAPKKLETIAPAPQIYSTQDNFCEVTKEKVEHRTDINKVFECLEKVLPQHDGWSTDGYGNISFEKEDTNASIALQKNKIEIHIYPETGSNLHIYLHKDHVNLDGVAPMFAQKWFDDHNKEFPGIENIFNVIQPFVENNAE